MGVEPHWREGSVDKQKPHFELRYGSADHGGWNEWIPVALVARRSDSDFIVEFLPGDYDAEVKRAVRRSIDAHLIESSEPDPWGYAVYHCGTTSNVYSDVHWSYVADPADF